MSYDQSVPNHYQHGSLLAAIESALPALGKTINSVNIEDLAPVDEFHIGGRLATENLFNQFNFRKDHHILDIGCGLGGAARYVAANYHTQVSGIDLTPEYIETGTELCSWLGLSRKITLT
ncbi:MAG: 2-polyprenyl-3-methyl-5-hydroxy-6-metoxy-1,4-benzoquinol methylase [Gammaproteobacteria bacterium]|jgi:2-polyprenyl-3-methyl-5-hydroxy-6-metoxy-1,4-benzoquinol methylase